MMDDDVPSIGENKFVSYMASNGVEVFPVEQTPVQQHPKLGWLSGKLSAFLPKL
jgi:hypothetical protein